MPNPKVTPGRIALCAAFVALAVFFGLAGLVLKRSFLGGLAGLCYVASCLVFSVRGENPQGVPPSSS